MVGHLQHGRLQHGVLLRQERGLPLGGEVPGDEEGGLAIAQAQDEAVVVVGGAGEGLGGGEGELEARLPEVPGAPGGHEGGGGGEAGEGAGGAAGQEGEEGEAAHQAGADDGGIGADEGDVEGQEQDDDGRGGAAVEEGEQEGAESAGQEDDDVLPTVLDVLGLGGNLEALPGKSFLPLTKSEAHEIRPVIVGGTSRRRSTPYAIAPGGASVAHRASATSCTTFSMTRGNDIT